VLHAVFKEVPGLPPERSVDFARGSKRLSVGGTRLLSGARILEEVRGAGYRGQIRIAANHSNVARVLIQVGSGLITSWSEATR
jgi:hypothetical protein